MNETVAVTAILSTTGEVQFRDYRVGMVFVPAGSSITRLAFFVAPYAGGTYVALADSTEGTTSSSSSSSGDDGIEITSGMVVLAVDAGRAYQLPDALAGCRAFKMVGDAAGSVDVSFQRSFA
jgi:hypothetical protein